MVFPISLWVVNKLMAVIPLPLHAEPLWQFGLFLYVYLGTYWVGDRFLRYVRWTFPFYEVEFARRQRFQNHRNVVWLVLLGVISTVIVEFVKVLAELRVTLNPRP